jgi:hypothetical protein
MVVLCTLGMEKANPGDWIGFGFACVMIAVGVYGMGYILLCPDDFEWAQNREILQIFGRDFWKNSLGK